MLNVLRYRGKAILGLGSALNFRGGWLIVALSLAALVALVCVFMPAIRVGDGMEYYGLYYAWTGTFRPWMTDISFDMYQKFHDAGVVIGTHGRDYLENAFPALKLGTTSDFNHFWFYSLLAAVIQSPLASVGLVINAHGAFMLLHVALFVFLTGVAYSCHGWRGFWTAVVMTLGSPIIWYVNKVHTEFLTYCLTLVGIILAMKSQLIAGAVVMSIAATQNPGLSFVPVAMLGLRGLGQWETKYSRWEVAGAITTVVLLALHPAYYFARYGVITPQLLAGGAIPGVGLSYSYIWLFDPDVGLFTNWPFGLSLLILGAIIWRNGVISNSTLYPKVSWHLWTVIAVFFLASLYSHASTENLNSGGSPGLARYALWYIPLIYPAALAVITRISTLQGPSKFQAHAAVSLAVAATCLFVMSMKYEMYLRPSTLSRFIQTYAPNLYTPPPEIFGERFSGSEPLYPYSAVVGPDCKKTLLLPAPDFGGKISVSEECPFDGNQIRNWIESKRKDIVEATYTQLDSQSIALPEPIAIGAVYHHNSETNSVRMLGWAEAEESHRWSNSTESTLRFFLANEDKSNLCLSITGFTYGQQEITARVNGDEVSKNAFDGDVRLVVPIGQRAGLLSIGLEYSRPQRPPNDYRLVAFALKSFSVTACD